MTRSELHRLRDELPMAAIDTAAEVLERVLHNPGMLADLPPWDDEPVTEEEQGRVAAARKERSIRLEDLIGAVRSSGGRAATSHSHYRRLLRQGPS